MDLWVVAAAAGAGYVAKYWNRISKVGDSSHHLSSEDSYFENPESPRCPFPFLKEAGRGKSGKDVSLDKRASDGKSSDVNSMDGLLSGEVASSRGLDSEKTRHFRNYNKNDVLSISNLGVSVSPNDNLKNVEDGMEQSSGIVGNHGFFLPDSSIAEFPIHNSCGHKTFLRKKHLTGHISRPLNSLESCFMAQLYKEHAEMEECVFSFLSSPSTSTRSFHVSNGSQIINRANESLFGASIGSKEYELHREPCQEKDENVFGVPSLPNIRSFNDAKKKKFNAVIGQSQRLSFSNVVFSGKHIHAQYAFIFSLGMSFGMITSIMENKREIDKLRKSLKQTENLVQDLQEELEMKDSMTVKELHNENYSSQDTCDHSFYDKELNGFSPEKHIDNSPRIDCKESYDPKEEQSSESMSKIEAELEAELERLGLDMKASSLERKVSNLVELDPEFVADFARGELRADTVSGKDFDHQKSNEDASDTTPLPGHYAVSPHELSLRLHEVKQCQLEERVKELEIALENSQRKVQLLESEHEGYFPKASSFSKGNSLTYEDCDPMAQPLILNLSGEALDAYNEAYEELIKINDSEENSPSGIHDTDHKEGSDLHDFHAFGVQHGGANGSITYSIVNGGRLSSDLSSNKVTMLEGQSSSICEPNVTEESSGCDNEVEKQLIRQIVERTKKGSPVFQNAKMILYSMEEDEH
ncbi:uncharacterized protein LOC133299503 isoform X2 [Gastrolobium bilobum]|uniref:uncharacterized protein LOC133299503 isoform X2 n=1 Tax=Gastrolobium bilobum TaxID=150636 RepID=UPI002AB00910|nr:uncharacterized protein LOC133299503 isoform X2 [Gastrolobium bilobum]